MKTTDDAINEFKAIWPNWADLTGEPICFCETTKKWYQLTTPLMHELDEVPVDAVCTRAQFSRRVRYLSKNKNAKSYAIKKPCTNGVTYRANQSNKQGVMN